MNKAAWPLVLMIEQLKRKIENAGINIDNLNLNNDIGNNNDKYDSTKYH